MDDDIDLAVLLEATDQQSAAQSWRKVP